MYAGLKQSHPFIAFIFEAHFKNQKIAGYLSAIYRRNKKHHLT